MIVKLAEPGKSYGGKSFKGLGAYLLHDVGKAKTSERVAWTHTLNLANDHPASAIDEMLWTMRAADMLKREAGLRAGGRTLEHPVKHVSLNWHPSETPTRAHMIETAERFLAHMGWQEHQALLVGHDDKAHAHVHLMLNAVHPVTGRALDTAFEKRRASVWAEGYERDQGLIFCEERLKPVAERTPSPTRATWEALRQSERQHDRVEVERVLPAFDYFVRHDAKTGDAKEWEALKTHQREQRDAFFVEGKQAYRTVRDGVFHEIREAFREEWRDYYAASRDGTDSEQLTTMKASILERQATALDKGRKAACGDLREQRDADYATLLREQKEQRAELTLAQKNGERSPELLAHIYGEPVAPRAYDIDGMVEHGRVASADMTSAFRQAGAETCEPARQPEAVERETEPAVGDRGHGDRTGVKDGADAVGGIAMSLLGGIATLGEKLFDGFLGGGPAAPPQQTPRTSGGAPVENKERDAAMRAAETQGAKTSEEAEAKKLRAYWDERAHRRHDRDGARV